MPSWALAIDPFLMSCATSSAMLLPRRRKPLDGCFHPQGASLAQEGIHTPHLRIHTLHLRIKMLICNTRFCIKSGNVEKSMNSTIHKCFCNVNAVPNPSQYPKRAQTHHGGQVYIIVSPSLVAQLYIYRESEKEEEKEIEREGHTNMYVCI